MEKLELDNWGQYQICANSMEQENWGGCPTCAKLRTTELEKVSNFGKAGNKRIWEFPIPVKSLEQEI